MATPLPKDRAPNELDLFLANPNSSTERATSPFAANPQDRQPPRFDRIRAGESPSAEPGIDEPEFELDAQGNALIPRHLLQAEPDAIPPEAEEEGGILDDIGEAFTGNKRSTPEIEALSEFGLGTPELFEADSSTLKLLAGLATTGDTKQLKRILQGSLPNASFRQDAKGNEIIDLPSGSYALNKPGFSGGDLGRVLVDIAAFTPATFIARGIAKNAVGRLVSNAALSAGTDVGLQATAQAAGGGEAIDTNRAALAGILGGVGEAASNVASGFQRTRGGLGAENQALIAQGEESGVRIFTSDTEEGVISQGLKRAAENLPVVGNRTRKLEQRAQREAAIDRAYGNLPKVTDEEIFENLQQNAKKLSRRAGRSLGNITRQMDDVGEVDLSAINQQIDQSLAKLNVRGQRDEKAIREITELRSALRPSLAGGFRFSDLRKQRTASRDIFSRLDDAGRSQLQSIGKAETGRILKSITQTLDNFVTTNGSPRTLRRYQLANRIYKQEADKLIRTRLKRTLDSGEVRPELVTDILFSQNKSDARHLFKSLSRSGKSNARAAMIQGMIKRATVEGQLSPTAFAKQIGKLEDNINVFFPPIERKRLKGMKRLFEATADAERGFNASSENVPGLITTGVTAIALLGLPKAIGLAGKIGGVARAYDSKLMRNTLLKLADNPVGSTTFNKWLNRLSLGVNGLIQSIDITQEEN